MTEALIGIGGALLLAGAYALGWYDRGQQEKTLRNVERLLDLALRRAAASSGTPQTPGPT